jgi:hypothetical protein
MRGETVERIILTGQFSAGFFFARAILRSEIFQVERTIYGFKHFQEERTILRPKIFKQCK